MKKLSVLSVMTDFQILIICIKVIESDDLFTSSYRIYSRIYYSAILFIRGFLKYLLIITKNIGLLVCPSDNAGYMGQYYIDPVHWHKVVTMDPSARRV